MPHELRDERAICHWLRSPQLPVANTLCGAAETGAYHRLTVISTDRACAHSAPASRLSDNSLISSRFLSSRFPDWFLSMRECS